jgi:hypothetical protein
MVEYGSDNNTSDKDTRMRNRFEQYLDEQEEETSHEKKKGKKKKRSIREGEAAAKSREADESGTGVAAGAYERDDTSERKDGLVAVLARALQKEDGKELEKARRAARLVTGKRLDDAEQPAEEADDTEASDETTVEAEDEQPPESAAAVLEALEHPDELEELSEDELQHVAQQLLEARHADLREEDETVPSDSEDAAALLLIETLAEKLDEGQLLDDEALEAAVQQVMHELEMHPQEEGATADAVDTTPQFYPEQVTANADPADLAPAPVGSVAGPVAPPGVPTPVQAALAGSSPPLVHHGGGGGGGHGAGTGAALAGGAMNGGGANVLPGATLNPNTLPFAAGATVERRGSRAGDLLIGGIIGYLIGRRRGRIKTEERLLPIQKSLERRVKDLHEKILIREEKIRQLTSEKVAREGQTAKEAVAEKVRARARTRHEARIRAKQEASSAPKIPANERHLATESEAERTIRPVAEVVARSAGVETGRVSERGPERLAKVVLPNVEHTPSVVSLENRPSLSKETVQVMPEVELLSLAARIETGGQTVKTLYDQGRLKQQDVREVVSAYTRGERIDKVLAERLLPESNEAETWERVPAMAGARKPSGSAFAGGGGGFAGSRTPAGSLAVASSADDATVAADNRLVQQTITDKRARTVPVTWVVAGGVSLGFLSLLLLL